MCPEVLAALAEANAHHLPGLRRRSVDAPRGGHGPGNVFETDCEVFFVFNGTASNCLSLWSLCESFHRVICHQFSHIQTDECGAPGFFVHGVTLHPMDTPDGKLTAGTVREGSRTPHGFHGSEPRVVSLTQTTELGTVYTPDDVRAIAPSRGS